MTAPHKLPASSPAADAIASARRTLATERAGIEALARALDGSVGEAFAAAVARIAEARGRVIVTGMGKSGHVGRKIAATFASTGTPAHFVHPAEASHGDLGMIQPDDVILAMSWSGETKELSDIVAHAARFGVTMIAFTSNAQSALAKAADVPIVLPKADEACPNGLAPTTSTTMQLALGDALAVALLEARGFSAHDFRVFHPGGKLGAQLKQVGEFMHGGDELPVVTLGTRMGDVVPVMTAKGFGCVLVTDASGHLKGIVTDGDLRRQMGDGFLERAVETVMTPDPISVAPDTLAAEALDILEKRRKGALAVVAEGRPIGLVHVLDLLKAGVA